jgi:hypothetical protein
MPAQLYCTDFVALLFVGRQLPTSEHVILKHLARMQPFPTFGATVNAVTMRDPVSLITPIIHSQAKNRDRLE